MSDEQRGVYTPDVDSERFDARYDSGNRGVWLLFGSILILLALVFFVWQAYADGTRARGDAPQILADTKPYKVTPEDPGGAQTPHQDKEVYDLIGGNQTEESVTLQPATEEPIIDEPKDGADNKVTITSNVLETQAPSPIPAPAPSPAPKPVSTDGKFVVQVAAYKTRDQAEAGWNSLKGKFSGTITGSMGYKIVRADLASGTVYRLQVTSFQTRAAADRLCRKLVAGGQECFVKGA